MSETPWDWPAAQKDASGDIMASSGHIWARLWKWARCLPSERCRLASGVGINYMIYILRGVGVFVVIFLPFVFSHYLWTLTLLFILWTSVNGWDQGIWAKRHCQGLRHIYREPQAIEWFLYCSTGLPFLKKIFTECWKLGLWITGRLDMIKALEWSVTLGQAPEMQAEVGSLLLFCFCRATHRKPSVLTWCWAKEWVTVSPDLSVAARCHDNHKEKQNVFSDWHMICIFFLIPLFKAVFKAPWSFPLHFTLLPKLAECRQTPGRIYLARWESFQAGLGLVPFIASQLLGLRSKRTERHR